MHMDDSNKDFQEKILQKIEEGLGKNDYWLYREYARSTKQKTYRFDGYLTALGGLPLAIIEIKKNLDDKFLFEKAKNQCINYLTTFHVPYAIFADEKKIYLIDEESLSVQKTDLTQIKKILEDYSSPSSTQIREALQYLKNLFPQEKLDNPNTNNEDQFYLPKQLESDIKDLILNNDPLPQKICRYVSLETAFSIISNKSIRMNCIVGMNDTSEVNFVGNSFYGQKYLDRIPWEKEKINDIYILSCSSIEKKDDLTQWRLYADDATGVCLVFDVSKPQYRYDVRKVTYIDPQKEKDSFFGRIQELVSKNNIIFRNFHTWCHFLKPKDYEIESEVRVLYDNQNIKQPHWFLAKPINVLSSYIEVELNGDFPLKLKEIILGPKCPEKEINRNQLHVLLKRNGFEGVNVDFSEIDNYR